MDSNIGKAKASKALEGFIPNPKLKLLDQVSEVMRFKHYSIRTETSYRGRDVPVDGEAAVWDGDEIEGMRAVAGEGCGF